MSSISTLPALPVQEGVEFRHIPDFPGYCVGDDGSVFGCLRTRGKYRGTVSVITDCWHRIQSSPNRNGYPKVDLRRGSDGERVTVTRAVHRLVLVAFVGPCPHGMEACHWDGDRANCRLNNLRWDTHAENEKDTARLKKRPRGSSNPAAKIDAETVLRIRNMAESGWAKMAISREIGISRRAVQKIVSRENWAWL